MKELSDCTVLVVDDTEANVDILVGALGETYECRRPRKVARMITN